MSGTAKNQNMAASEKLCRWTSDIMLLGPTIEYIRGPNNVIADSLSRLRTNDHYIYEKQLENNEPIRLDDKMEINMVQTRAQTAGWDTDTQKLPELQVRVWDILKVSDKRQLIRNTEDILETLDPIKLQELQDNDPSITKLQWNRKTSITADKDNILIYAVDIKGRTVQAILLPKAPRPWIIANMHEFSGHQGDQHLYNKIRVTFFWNGMRNDICQAIAKCRVCKMESPNLGKYMNLHLEIGIAPMHFLAMDMIEIRNTKSPYQYAFTLIDMLTNYVFVIPVKDISGKTLVHEYIYKVYLPFRCTEKFLSDNGTSFLNKHWRNLAKALAFKHIQSSSRNPRANRRIENIHNFLKWTTKKIMHSNPSMQWHEVIQIAAHNYNTFTSALNGYSPFLLHFGREDSNPLWNKLNPGNTVILQGDITQSIQELHKLWKAHAEEIMRNRSKGDNKNITSHPPLKLHDGVLI